MQIRVLLLFAFSLGSMAGCGNPLTSATTKPSPNGLTLSPLPGDRGYFEIKADGEPAPRGARGKGRTGKIFASFYQPDGTTLLKPVPVEVSVKLGTSDASKTVVLNPNTDKARSEFQFSSVPGEYPDSLRGTLHATLGGETIEVPFSVR
jgi:hypothetical protein